MKDNQTCRKLLNIGILFVLTIGTRSVEGVSAHHRQLMKHKPYIEELENNVYRQNLQQEKGAWISVGEELSAPGCA